jgi:hypothetical protein
MTVTVTQHFTLKDFIQRTDGDRRLGSAVVAKKNKARRHSSHPTKSLQELLATTNAKFPSRQMSSLSSNTSIISEDLCSVNITEAGEEESRNDDCSCRLSPTSGGKKRVSWSQDVEIREYNVIPAVAAPAVGTAFKMTLDWEHSETIIAKNPAPERGFKCTRPRKLSKEERRRRLYGDDLVEDRDNPLSWFAMVDHNLDDLLKQIEDSLAQMTIAPLPKCFSVYDPESGYRKKEQRPKRKGQPHMIQWQRVAR